MPTRVVDNLKQDIIFKETHFMSIPGFDSSQAINYHYGAFPPTELEYNSNLVSAMAEAAGAIASYEQMLKGMHNTRLFLTP